MELDVKNQYWMGKIPDSWETKKIKFVLSQRNEINVPIKSTEILSLTAKQGVIPYSEKEGGGNKPKQDFSAYKLTYPGDIVMNSMNILSGAVGLSKYMGCISPVYYALKPKNNTDDVRFFYYVFANKTFQNSLLGLGNGILIKQSDNGNFNTIRMRIPIEKLNSLSVPYPSPSIQQQIANYLDNKTTEIDGLIDKINAEIDLLERYKHAVISNAVTIGIDSNSKLKTSNVDYIPILNSNWRITKLGYICNKLMRPFNSTDTALICSNQGKVIERPDSASGIMVSGDNAMQGIKNGDIAIHGMDTWHGAIALSNKNGKITRVVHVCESIEDNRFIVYYLQHLAFQGVYKLISNGVRGNTSDFRSWEKVKNIYISIPESMQEQVRICDYLDELTSKIDKNINQKQQQITQLTEYKNSLIFEYVTGKKQVKEAN